MRPIAFYAPLKTPNHPTPSGDRQIARNVMSALSHAFDTPVVLASELRSFEPKGSVEAQQDLFRRSQTERARILKDLRNAGMWVTYHNYYKAPDLIGPHVSKALGIPYIQIEASRAKSRLSGPWARFAQAAHDASDAADIIFHVTNEDLIALKRDRFGKQRIVELPPFLDRETLPETASCSDPMLVVGMMRHGDKLASYQLIADALHLVRSPNWALRIAGDGEARKDVEALFKPFGDRVEFLGALNPGELVEAYAASSLLFWPGVNEAFGMVYLEAQAAGLPVLAQSRPGVCDVLAPGNYPSIETGKHGLAVELDKLLADDTMRIQLGRDAQNYVRKRHLRPAAVQILQETLGPLIEDVT